MIIVTIPETYSQVCFRTDAKYARMNPQIYAKFGAKPLRTYDMIRCWIDEKSLPQHRIIFLLAQSPLGKYDFVYGKHIMRSGIIDIIDHRWLGDKIPIDDLLQIFSNQFRIELKNHEVNRNV